MSESTKQVYAAINAIQHELAKVGISKQERNQSQGYNFRGIDTVYNVLSPLLAKHKLCILPRVINRTLTQMVTTKGSAMNHVAVESEFDFVSAEDGSIHTCKTWGEAMDSGDKATNKAMSAAYKYAAFQAFAIPTEGDNDADATTPEPIAAPPKQQSAHKSEPKPEPKQEPKRVGELREYRDKQLKRLTDSGVSFDYNGLTPTDWFRATWRSAADRLSYNADPVKMVDSAWQRMLEAVSDEVGSIIALTEEKP